MGWYVGVNQDYVNVVLKIVGIRIQGLGYIPRIPQCGSIEGPMVSIRWYSSRVVRECW